MEKETAKASSSSVSKYKKKLTPFFDSLSQELKASSRRVQLYGEILLSKLAEAGPYSEDPLCSKAGVAAFKNALKLYNIGTTALDDSSAGITDLDGMSDGYKTHVALGVEIFGKNVPEAELSGKDALYWQTLRDVLAFHHERWDGSGYPNGVSTTDIPLSARICAVVNYFETLTTSGFERDKMTTESAAEEIERRANTYFDPALCEALKQSVDSINEALENGTVSKVTTGNSTVRAIEQLYRSVFDYGNHMPFGYDTDMRLNDKELGVVSSRVFVPVAEKSAKINELSKWAVEEVCNTLNHLKKRNRFTGLFFVDLSVKSLLKKNFTDNLAKIVKKCEIAADELCFVISESLFSFNIEKVAEALLELRGHGFKTAIGDFGSESVNLTVLQKLDVDYVFLNPEFVSDIVVSPRAKKIVASVIEMANKLDIIVIADGVVEKQQAKELYTMGCNIMCGPYYGRFTAVTVI